MENRISIGPNKTSPLFSFENEDLRSISANTAVDIVGTNLSIDRFQFVADYPADGIVDYILGLIDVDAIVSSDGFTLTVGEQKENIRNIPYGTPLYYEREEELKNKMYVSDVERQGKNTFKVSSVSAIGLLDSQKHYGGLYSGATFSQVLGEIIDGAVPYTVEENVSNLPVYGWLPYATKRENLHQLLFATGVSLRKDENGDIKFVFLDIDQKKNIPQGKIYQSGSVNYPAFASAVDVTEHSFFSLPTDETVAVYDNTDGSETADHTFVAFRDGPLHNLESTGSLVINESGVNYAIVTGTGVLKGKKYTHSTRVLYKGSDNTDQKENVATVDNAYLVTVLNSQNVADRVLAYYSSRKTVSMAILQEDEKSGDCISGVDPYDEQIDGFIESMDTVISSVVKSTCKVVTGYYPTGQGNNYNNYIILTGSGVWNIPQEILSKENPEIQAQLISGGHGGFKGQDGTRGINGTVFDGYGTPGIGGKGGNFGPGGKVLTIKLDLSEKTKISFNCGVGGESDSPGGPTIFGEYTSDNGEIPPFGVSNLFTGEVYALSGVESGISGGDGSGNNGAGLPVTYNGQTWYPGAKGASVRGENKAGSDGGWGGGASVGSNGGKGVDGEISSSGDAGGSEGGNGANGRAGASSEIIGQGGSGGFGGGGAGLGGAKRDEGDQYWFYASNGQPGLGGLGGKGGPGAIIIYY